MVSVIFSTVIYLMSAYLLYASLIYPTIGKERPSPKKDFTGIGILLCAGFVLRIILSGAYPGHSTDMNCFKAWSDMIYNDGLGAFYASETFTDYPPGYMYVLYVIAAVKNLFNISGDFAVNVLTKLPAVLCDCVLSYILYRKASQKFSQSCSLILTMLLLFSPAVFIDSALWGQVDSVFTLFIVLMILCVMENKMIASYFLFAASIFIKPQAFIFTPVIIYGIIENVFMAKKELSVVLKNLMFGLCAILALLLLSMPFGLGYVLKQYVNTFASYPYMTINAFNLWGAFGQNWKEVSLFASIISYTFMVGIVAMTVPVFLKIKGKEKYALIALLLSMGSFMLMTKMHERYAFPCLFLFMLLYIYMPSTATFSLFSLSHAMQFINTAFVLFVYESDMNKYFRSPIIVVFSILNVAFYAFMLLWAGKFIKKPAPTYTRPAAAVKKAAVQCNIARTEQSVRITKADIAIMLAITAIYSCIALYNLGDRIAPETGRPADGITLELEEQTALSKIMFFTGSTHLEASQPLKLTLSDSDKNTVKSVKLDEGSVFAWHEQSLGGATAKYITVACANSEYEINELALSDADGNLIVPKNADEYAVLFDEQDIVPEHISYKNGTYFDEIYHARTAYEFTVHDSVYEWTHPPLGKVLISIGIQLFGMNPFGWRIVGTVFGIFMVPVIYLFAKRIVKHTWLAAVTCILFTFDFMHFSQTRIATIDVYVTFFIMLMYYFMYKYYNTSFYDTRLSKTFVPLGLCGVVMGLAIASKWTGIYAAAGLAVLFFMTLYKRFVEYRYALSAPDGETDGISHRHIIDTFKSSTVKTIIFCCIFYIAVPALIYYLSYIPYLKAPNMHGIKSIIENQKSMYSYHSDLVAEHSFASEWYKWPIMYKPIWYYSGKISDTLKEGISSFGNPAVWWVGIAAFAYQVYLYVKNRDKTSLFLILSYAAQLIPWIPVSRLTFIYHYFPSVPFVVLMIGYSLYHIYRTNPPTSKIINVRNICFIYALAAIALFAMFYPILSGMPIDPEYVHENLEWFNSWYFI